MASGMIFLNESVSHLALIGGILVLAGLALSICGKRIMAGASALMPFLSVAQPVKSQAKDPA
jgi:hypothetical protein